MHQDDAQLWPLFNGENPGRDHFMIDPRSFARLTYEGSDPHGT